MKAIVSLFVLGFSVVAHAQYTASQLTNLVRTELPMQTGGAITPTNLWNVFDAVVASQPWNTINPRRSFVAYEDFINGVVGGSYVWVGTATASGVGTALPSDGDHIGIFEMRTAAATNSTYTINSHVSQFGITTNMTLRFRAQVKLGPLSTATDDYVVFIGFGDLISSLADVDRLGFEYSDNINGGNWRLASRKASADSFGNSTVAAGVPTGTWHTLQFDATATQITGSVDGVAVTPIVSNIPLTANKMGICHKIISTGRGAGTGIETCAVDWFLVNIDYGVNR